MTMAASTRRPSATIRPVTDIWWIGTASALSVATEASETTGQDGRHDDRRAPAEREEEDGHDERHARGHVQPT